MRNSGCDSRMKVLSWLCAAVLCNSLDNTSFVAHTASSVPHFAQARWAELCMPMSVLPATCNIVVQQSSFTVLTCFVVPVSRLVWQL